MTNMIVSDHLNVRSMNCGVIQSDQYRINHFVSTDDHFQKDSKIKEELVDNEDENQEIEHDYYTAEELYENYPNEYLEQQYENENYDEELSTTTNYEPEVHIGEKYLNVWKIFFVII